jgi:hypothetical protein
MDWQSVFCSSGNIDGSRGNHIERNTAEVAPIRRWSEWGLMLFQNKVFIGSQKAKICFLTAVFQRSN